MFVLLPALRRGYRLSLSPSSAPALLIALLAIFMIWLGAAPSPAEAAPVPAPSLRFKKLGPLGGDEPSMLSMMQDRKGYVWVGTHTNGLYRYNGYHAVKYLSLIHI